MSKFRVISWLLLACIALTAWGAAAEYTDDFWALGNDPVRTYTNLSPYTLKPAAMSLLPDSSFASFAAPFSSFASVQYTASGAKKIVVGLYTNYGTFISPAPGVGGSYLLGGYEHFDNSSALSYPQAQFSPAQGIVCAVIGDSTYARRGLANDFTSHTPLPGDLVYYGLNVYALSSSGTRHLNGTRTMVAYIYNANYCYEEYTFFVPSGASGLRIELNDFITYIGNDGALEPRPTTRMAALARVSIFGDALVLGTVEPIIDDEIAPPSPASSASARKNPAATAPAKAASSTASAAAQSSASKFDGYAFAEEKKDAPSQEAAPTQNSPRAAAVENLTEESSPRDAASIEPVVYRSTAAPATSHTSRTNIAIIAYIVVVSGVLLSAILRQR